MVRWSALVAVLAAVGACAGWQRVDALTPDSLTPTQHVQVWSANRARVLHGVTVDADSVRGVPFQLPLSCDSCRVSYARSAVDSVRLGSERSLGAGWVLGVGGLLLFCAVLIAGFKHGQS